jgi:hypothetical protein
MRRLVLAALGAVMAGAAAASPIATFDRMELDDLGEKAVIAVLHHDTGAVDGILRVIEPERRLQIDETDTLLVRARADRVAAAAGLSSVRQIELVDPTVANRVASILQAMSTVTRQHGHVHDIGALNISLGAPKVLLGANRSAEAAVRRSLAHFASRHRVPVVMSIGNNGPTPGLTNPWGQAPGIILATATDARGRRLWSGSSRFTAGRLGNRDVFAAHGYLHVGAQAAGATKTPAMLEAEKQVDLTAIVGAGNEHRYRVDSGTSYAAAEVTRCLCVVHQAIHLLRQSAKTAPAREETLPPFVRAYLDTGIDETHPMFQMRLADRMPVYSGMSFEISADRRDFFRRIAKSAPSLRFDYDYRSAVSILRGSAAPVPGTTQDETGHGFVHYLDLLAHLAGWRTSQLGTHFLDPDERRAIGWETIAQAQDAKVFSEAELGKIRGYCENFDLILMHKIQ